MLNFFVNLINSIGIPVVFIGTNSMISLFSDVLRNARRGCGLGVTEFQRFEKGDPIWRMLVESLWEYQWRSEEHTSELQSLMRISYAVFCLKKKKQIK